MLRTCTKFRRYTDANNYYIPNNGELHGPAKKRRSGEAARSYLDLDISFSGEQAELYMQKAIVMTLSAVDTLKRLVFVGNLFDSLKFLVLMYLVTFLGALCNGLTVFIICVIALFSLPLFYRQRQEQVDKFFANIQAKVDNIKDIFVRIAQGGGPPPDPTPGGTKPNFQ
ncbi:reticulon-1-A-like [Pleuronectes platessa]|uniref:reticulon-1-A-like n=1 Tax=Pleuronectes platessa TaxID=8262 RepID=UPI00232A298E|nr:reticulon-1-A-like [Pleuronectes platessa]XP_053278068.1 reticulon-1-A-like [Pleuronectes platessa]